ncbi:MAG: methylated-DNA--[protein]-cysteine S-methyltransferase [Desulfobacterales bacterium]|nr:methylated-DNA--[protein]-cysteine S-methyltransferase [Desulfobacterales bacterium]
MEDFAQLSRDYTRIEKAIDYIEAHQEDQPSLAGIAGAVDLSEFHFQKLFSRWVGISPKRFLQFLTKEHAKKLLADSKNILDVTYETGLSSPGRLHDLFISCEAMTPGAYKDKGRGLDIKFGFTPTPFGCCMLAFTAQGICNLKFVRDYSREEMAAWLASAWPKAGISRNDDEAAAYGRRIFALALPDKPAPLHLFIRGTNFQIKVWEALTRIPIGTTVTYQDIAGHIGHPGAVRAVGTAVGKNPVPYIIPCHRVIRKMGIFGNYGEGKSRKKAILGWESARTA